MNITLTASITKPLESRCLERDQQLNSAMDRTNLRFHLSYTWISNQSLTQWVRDPSRVPLANRAWGRSATPLSLLILILINLTANALTNTFPLVGVLTASFRMARLRIH